MRRRIEHVVRCGPLWHQGECRGSHLLDVRPVARGAGRELILPGSVGAEAVSTLHRRRNELGARLIGACERVLGALERARGWRRLDVRETGGSGTARGGIVTPTAAPAHAVCESAVGHREPMRPSGEKSRCAESHRPRRLVCGSSRLRVLREFAPDLEPARRRGIPVLGNPEHLIELVGTPVTVRVLRPGGHQLDLLRQGRLSSERHDRGSGGLHAREWVDR